VDQSVATRSPSVDAAAYTSRRNRQVFQTFPKFDRKDKWEKVTANYLEKYKEFISYYFTFVATSRLRVRLMFTQNIHVSKRTY
jgi:hypothetical protein